LKGFGGADRDRTDDLLSAISAFVETDVEFFLTASAHPTMKFIGAAFFVVGWLMARKR
jgi:hypothetical protein